MSGSLAEVTAMTAGGGARQGQQPVQKLLAVHLGGVVVQNDQVGPVLRQVVQGGQPIFKDPVHLEPAVRLHILPVNGGHHRVVLDDQHMIGHGQDLSFVNVRVKQVPVWGSVSRSMVPPRRWVMSQIMARPSPRPGPLEEKPR